MKHVLIVYDVAGWAWHRRALGIQKYAPPQYSVDIVSVADFDKREASRYDAVLNLDFASVPPLKEHPNFWGFIANEGICYEYKPDSPDFRQRCASPAKNAKVARERIPHYRGVITVNQRTLSFLRTLNPNTHYLRTGVDCETFYPTKPIRTRGTLRVGWCGKPSSGSRFSPKGYHEVLLPLQERLKDADIEWHVNTHTYEDGYDADGMREWYNDIDLLLITSSSEGTPSVLLEAMACGRGFVSTDVGIVWEVLRCDDCGRKCGQYYLAEHTDTVVFGLESILRSLRHGCNYSRGGVAYYVADCYWNWNRLAAQWLERITT